MKRNKSDRGKLVKNGSKLAAAPTEKPERTHLRNGSLPFIRTNFSTEKTDGDNKIREEDDFLKGQLDFNAIQKNEVTPNVTFQDLWKVVKHVTAQNSTGNMYRVMEQKASQLVQALSMRYFIVGPSSLIHGSKSYPVNKGLVGHVYSTGEIVCLSNPQLDKRYDPTIDQDPTVLPGGSLMLVPVVADASPDCDGTKDTIGIFAGVKKKDSPEFTARDCTVLYRLSELIGNVLRTAQRLEKANAKFDLVEVSRKRSAALLDVAKALGSENRLLPLVSLIVKQVPELLDCDRSTLYFVDNEKKQLIVTRGSSHGRPKSFVGWIFGQSNAPELPFHSGNNEIRFPISKGIAGHVCNTGESVQIADAHNDVRFNPEVDKATGYRTRSVLCVPMTEASGTVIGVLQAINKNPLCADGFSNEDRVLCETFSAQAAVAVKNSKLFEMTQKALDRTEALLEVTNALSKELQLPALLKVVVDKVQKLLRAQRCTVFLVDENKKELYTNDNMTTGMGSALPIDHEREDMVHFPMNRGIAGSVATTGESINVVDAYQDARFNRKMDDETGFRTKSILCMPIRNHSNEIIGVTQVINRYVTKESDDNDGKEAFDIVEFDAEDEKLLFAFNAQAAVAIENSRLFTNTEKALNHSMAYQRNLRFLLNVTKNLFSDMHLSSMIEQITMQVHHLLRADDCALYLVDPATHEYFLAREQGTGPHTRYPFSVGIVGTVASTGQIIRISHETHRDPRFHEAVDQRKGHVTHSVLCCPIKVETSDNKQQVIGVISVRDEKDRGGFEKEEENLLKLFCAQASVAIINIKKFSNMLDQSDFKHTDHSAADYLMIKHGMHLAGDNIEKFEFAMDEVHLKQRIGSGSYGEVYKGQVRDKVVAVKKLHMNKLKAEQVDSFCKEAGLMCQLDHPNVVQFIGAVTEPSNLCIITEFCARGSLADLILDSNVKMSPVRKLKFALDAARGMLYLHSSNPIILHRDLKSDNLLVTENWTVKVADFGLTRFMSENKAMTQVGTPMWMAPEIIMGKKYTEKADVYAFGIILWEILTRGEPYEDKEPMQIVVEVVNEALRPTIDKQFEDDQLVPLMKHCWNPDPDQRPPFKVIVERLEDIYAKQKVLEGNSATAAVDSSEQAS